MAILATLLPTNFKHPKPKNTMANIDTQVHIYKFDSFLQLYLGENKLMENLFKGTLIGIVASLHNNLPNGSLNSWDELK